MKALITGASSGMGRDMAKILSQKGYYLILVARDEKKLEEVKKQLKTETKIVVMDISNEENCKLSLSRTYTNPLETISGPLIT